MQTMDTRTTSGDSTSGLSGKERLVARKEPPCKYGLRRRQHVPDRAERYFSTTLL
jgi:hypothetical protein